MVRNLINFVAFQAGWFVCVMGSAQGHAGLGTLAVGLVLALHLWMSGQWRAELWLAIYAALIGLVVETILINAGAAHYASPSPIGFLPPVWIIAMWVLLATALNASLSWLQGRFVLAAMLGAVLAPLSYSGGAKLGGMVFAEPLWHSFALIAALWAVAMPAVVWCAGYVCRAVPSQIGVVVEP